MVIYCAGDPTEYADAAVVLKEKGNVVLHAGLLPELDDDEDLRRAMIRASGAICTIDPFKMTDRELQDVRYARDLRIPRITYNKRRGLEWLL